MPAEEASPPVTWRSKAFVSRARRAVGRRLLGGAGRHPAIEDSYDGDAEVFVQRAYLTILGRPADRAARRLVADLGARRLTPQQVVDSLVDSSEFARRLGGATPDGPAREGSRLAGPAVTPPDGYLDPKALIDELGIDRLLGTAESYFSAMPDPQHLFAKPFASVHEAPEILVSLGQLLACFKPLPDQVVLDFGAGSCWTSRALAQLGVEVIACDASETALRFGRQLFERNPVVGDKPEPRFLHFDGYKLELEDASVDAVCVFDAFHHVPNPHDVLAEFFRVLRPGGVAAFSEVGEQHSRTPLAQQEMRSFGVLENDIVLSELWPAMEGLGFENLQVNVFATSAFMLPLAAFEEFLGGAGSTPGAFLEATRRSLSDRRMFLVRKPGVMQIDSRQIEALDGKLSLRSASAGRHGGSWRFSGLLDVENSGAASWLPAGRRVGSVAVGMRIPGAATVDVGRIELGTDAPIPSGARLEVPFEAEVAAEAFGQASELELSLVSDGVTWFGPTVRIAVPD